MGLGSGRFAPGLTAVVHRVECRARHRPTRRANLRRTGRTGRPPLGGALMCSLILVVFTPCPLEHNWWRGGWCWGVRRRRRWRRAGRGAGGGGGGGAGLSLSVRGPRPRTAQSAPTPPATGREPGARSREAGGSPSTLPMVETWSAAAGSALGARASLRASVKPPSTRWLAPQPPLERSNGRSPGLRQTQTTH